LAKPSLLAIPLGGLGEFGMNMLVLHTGDDMILIDAGMMFPEVELLGVDIVIPDITYLKQNRQQHRAIRENFRFTRSPRQPVPTDR
jgi:ribonuclease J